MMGVGRLAYFSNESDEIVEDVHCVDVTIVVDVNIDQELRVRAYPQSHFKDDQLVFERRRG